MIGVTVAWEFEETATLAASRLRSAVKSAPGKVSSKSLMPDWPKDVPVTEAEIEVFEAWFGELFDDLFSTRN